MSKKHCFYIGTYTQPIQFGTGEVMEGKGEGIYRALLDEDTLELSWALCISQVDNPSYLNLSPNNQFLYAVNELKSYQGDPGGSVSAFALDAQGQLLPLNIQPTMGLDPCYVACDPLGHYVSIANFMSGSVGLYPIGEDGRLLSCSCFIQHQGSSIDPRRQAGPHAHAAVFDPSGQFMLVPDLGIDQVLVYRIDRQCHRLSLATQYTAAPGAGPRSCEFHPTLPICYLINELSSSISALHFDESTGKLEHMQTQSTLQSPYDGENICADLHVTCDGRFLYGSNRGHDSLVCYEIDTCGYMRYVDTVSCGGRTPRNFAILEGEHKRILLVGNQDSDAIVLFSACPTSGTLCQEQSVSLATPVCIRQLAGPQS